MQQKIKVSVIIPVYGVEKYIERCARSLFSQTLKEMEFIFVDDCTPDKSMQILDKVINDYPERQGQIIVLRHEKNKGLPQARKSGIEVAKGEYIAHCDSDDWVEKTMYEKMYNFANNKEIDIVYCDFYRTNGTSKEYSTLNANRALMSGPVWNKLIKKELYYNNIIYPTANKAEDGALMLQLSYYATNREHLKEALYYYFNNPESICRVPTKEACIQRLQEECTNTELRIRFLKGKGLEKKFEQDIIRWKYVCRKNIVPYIENYYIYKIWKDTYPEINSKYVFTRGISIRSKLVFLIIYFGLLPVVSKKVLRYY